MQSCSMALCMFRTPPSSYSVTTTGQTSYHVWQLIPRTLPLDGHWPPLQHAGTRSLCSVNSYRCPARNRLPSQHARCHVVDHAQAICPCKFPLGFSVFDQSSRPSGSKAQITKHRQPKYHAQHDELQSLFVEIGDLIIVLLRLSVAVREPSSLLAQAAVSFHKPFTETCSVRLTPSLCFAALA